MISCSDMDLVNYMENIHPTEKELAHMQNCAQCRAELLQLKHAIDVLIPYFDYLHHADALSDPPMKSFLEDFDSSVKNRPDPETQPLPSKLKKMVQKKRVAARTRHALEKLIGKGAKTNTLIRDLIGQTLSGPQTQGAPAARDDLTDAGDENKPIKDKKSFSFPEDPKHTGAEPNDAEPHPSENDTEKKQNP